MASANIIDVRCEFPLQSFVSELLPQRRPLAVLRLDRDWYFIAEIAAVLSAIRARNFAAEQCCPSYGGFTIETNPSCSAHDSNVTTAAESSESSCSFVLNAYVALAIKPRIFIESGDVNRVDVATRCDG